MKIPRLAALLVGVLHLTLISAIAASIFLRDAEQPSTEAWLFAACLDLPVYYLSFPLIPMIPHLPRVSGLPGIAGEWEPFLFLLIWFGVLGTAQWSIIGWGIGKAYVQVKSKSPR